MKTQTIENKGTGVNAIDHAENRFKFSKLCDQLQIDQPEWFQFINLFQLLHLLYINYNCILNLLIIIKTII